MALFGVCQARDAWAPCTKRCSSRTDSEEAADEKVYAVTEGSLTNAASLAVKQSRHADTTESSPYTPVHCKSPGCDDQLVKVTDRQQDAQADIAGCIKELHAAKSGSDAQSLSTASGLTAESEIKSPTTSSKGSDDQGQTKAEKSSTRLSLTGSLRTPQRSSEQPDNKKLTKQGKPQKSKQAAQVEKEIQLPKQQILAETEEEGQESGCPASKKPAVLQKELRAIKKKQSTKSAKEKPKDVASIFIGTELSAVERQIHKDMFLSFYREQYGRLKSTVTPDTTQYSESETNGLKITGGHRYMPRPENVDLPTDFKKPVGSISAKKLASYGSSNERKFICIHGDLFDVSDRPDKYGDDGPYWYMAGHDITWGLISADDSEEAVDKYYDVFKIVPQERMEKKFQGLMSWWAFYEKEYGSPVGRLDLYDKEWELPTPPEIEDACSLM